MVSQTILNGNPPNLISRSEPSRVICRAITGGKRCSHSLCHFDRSPRLGWKPHLARLWDHCRSRGDLGGVHTKLEL